MLTEFGKELRIVRLKRNKKLKDMADDLNISPSYLSSVENGKRNLTKEFVQRLFESYNFDIKEKEEIEEAYVKTVRSITISFDKNEEDLVLLFYKNFHSLSERKKLEIKNILNKL